MSAAANLTMYLVDLNQTVAATAATLINATGEGSATADGVATMVIPKRIPVDSAEWFKTFGRQFMDTEVNQTQKPEQQADALLSDLRLTLSELRRTLF
jgi:hypothetical protein